MRHIAHIQHICGTISAMIGNDGGDCDTEKRPCNALLKGNGICNTECNQAYNNWDGGDCCNPAITVHCVREPSL